MFFYLECTFAIQLSSEMMKQHILYGMPLVKIFIHVYNTSAVNSKIEKKLPYLPTLKLKNKWETDLKKILGLMIYPSIY